VSMAFLWLWITLAFRGKRATKNQTKHAFHVVLAVLRLRKNESFALFMWFCAR
jgi:hypothetical protein